MIIQAACSACLGLAKEEIKMVGRPGEEMLVHTSLYNAASSYILKSARIRVVWYVNTIVRTGSRRGRRGTKSNYA